MDYSSILSKPKSFFGKQKVWMARGEDLALFNTHRPNIQNLLRHSCIPESSHNLWIGLYRVGTTEEEAKTFVVVSCTDRRIRKLTRDILSSCPIFQPGEALDRFKVISKATLPETACEPQQTMQDEQELECELGLRNQDTGKNIAKDEYKTIRISPSLTGDSYLCRQVQARHVSGKGEVRFQTATAGPLINVDGRIYQLTVAHVVNFETKDIHHTIESTTDDWDDWDEEIDDDINSGCSVDEYVASWDISTSRNSTPDASDDDIPSSFSSDSAFEVATQRCGSGAAVTEATSTDEEPIDESVNPHSSPDLHLSESPVLEEFLIDHASPYLGFAPGSENCQISTEMDYLLIPTNADLQAGVCTSKSAELIQMSEAFDLQDKTEPLPVIIATASVGYMEGVIFPASSLLRPPGSKNFQTLYCIESDNAMPKGTSGSAVFDKLTGLVAGYIVLGCPEKNIWYMAPIMNVLNDLEVRFGQKGNCQIHINVAAAMGLNVVDMETASVKEVPQFSLLGGPAIQRDQESLKQTVSKSPKTTQWGRINGTITSILKGFQPEDSVPLDHWSHRFGQKTHSTDNDRLLLARFKALKGAFLDAMTLILSHPQYTFKDHQMTEIQQTHDNRFAMTESTETMESCSHDRKDGPQPTAWMLDIFRPSMNKGQTLDTREIFALRQGKNLASDSPDNDAYTPQCLYIKNPDPKGITALCKVPSHFAMARFQEFFSSYIAPQPDPMIKLTQDGFFVGASFTITINLPFLVIASRVEVDKRCVAGDTGLRRNYSIRFLDQQQQLRDFRGQNRRYLEDESFLCQGVCSVIVTGTSDRYWTAACLDDDLTDDTTMLDTTTEGTSEDIPKPISPRAYALKALAIILEKVARYHYQAQLALENGLILFERNTSDPAYESHLFHLLYAQVDFFRTLKQILRYNSRVLETLDTFLSKDLSSSPDRPAEHILWASFYRDPGSSESLPRIQNSLSLLRETQNHLEILDGRLQELMRKRDALVTTHNAPVPTQNAPVKDDYSTPWFTLAAYLVAIIAIIYDFNQD